MAVKIVIASGKGGVGKSTTAAALGKALAADGKRTLLIDCDAGLRSLDLLVGGNVSSHYHWQDVLEDRCDPLVAVTRARENLSLLSAPVRPPQDLPDDCLTGIVDAIENDFDLILLDAPAGLGQGLRRAALPADHALILATADEVSVRGASAAAETLRTMGVDDARLIVNRYSLKDAKKGKYLSIDEVIDKTVVRLIGVVPEDPALTAYSVTGLLPKKSKSAQAFMRIARRLIGQTVPLELKLLK